MSGTNGSGRLRRTGNNRRRRKGSAGRRRRLIRILVLLAVLFAMYPALRMLHRKGVLPKKADRMVSVILRVLDGDETVLIQNPEPAAASGLAPLPAQTDGYLIVDCMDVGQGDAALIRQGSHAMLFDCGGEDPQRAAAYLREQGISHLDAVWLSHADLDHVSGFPALAEACTVDAVYMSPFASEKETWTYEKSMQIIRDRKIRLIKPSAGETFLLGDAMIRVIGPETMDPEIENNHSLAVRISYGDTAFLFCGDAQEEEEAAIASGPFDCSADVLHVNHHGSNSSSTRPFLQAVRPSFALISCGVENEYGHPGEYALKRLAECGALILRTDRQGTVRFLSDGSHISWSSERGGEQEAAGG